MKPILCLAFLIAAAAANAYGGYESHPSRHFETFETIGGKRFVKILRLVGSTDNAGNYNFDSEGEDGTKMTETGGLKVIKGETGATKAGTVSWTSPENQHFTLSYTADENGFRPVASHLPVSPPIPEEIKKSLLLLPKLDLSQYDNKPTIAATYTPYSSYVVPMKPVAPPKELFAMPSFSSAALPPAPPASHVEFLKPVQEPAPTKMHVETPEFLIDSEPAKTFFRIGRN